MMESFILISDSLWNYSHSEFCFSSQGQLQEGHWQCDFMIICNVCWTVPQKAQPMSDGVITALVGSAQSGLFSW